MAKNLCSNECSFSDFFKNNYEELIYYLEPNSEEKSFYDILFNAYSIKFEGLDYEYKMRCESLNEVKEANETKQKCLNMEARNIRDLANIAMEEYDNFLDDLNFEICGMECSEHKIIKKNKKKYRKKLHKEIISNCK